MKTAVIAATLVALGLGLSGAYAQNANDRPGMTAPQEGTISKPNQPGSIEQSPAGSANNRRQSGNYQIHGRASGWK